MILADLAVAGFYILVAMVAFVVTPWFLFSIFGLVESFFVRGSRGLACVSFMVSGLICAWCASYLLTDVQVSSEVAQSAVWVVAFPAVFVAGFLIYLRISRRRRLWSRERPDRPR